MNTIIPLSTNITPLESLFDKPTEKTEESALPTGQPTFLDVFKDICANAATTQQQKADDVTALMLGEDVSLEQLQINLTKAEVATELLVNVKNAAVDAYNEIIKMSI